MSNAKHGWTFSQVPIWATCDPRISDGAHRLFSYLVWRQGNNPDAWPSIPRMAEDLHVSEGTIRRRIKELDECGYTNITRRAGRSSRYAMTANPDGVSERYTPGKNEPPSKLEPLADLEGDPSQNWKGTPSKNARHNDSKERESKNNIRESKNNINDSDSSSGPNGHTAELTRLYEETTGRTLNGHAFQEIEDYWRDLPDIDTWRYAFRQAADKRAPWAYAKAILESKIKEQERREAQMPKPAEAYEDIDAFMGGLT